MTGAAPGLRPWQRLGVRFAALFALAALAVIGAVSLLAYERQRHLKSAIIEDGYERRAEITANSAPTKKALPSSSTNSQASPAQSLIAPPPSRCRRAFGRSTA